MAKGKIDIGRLGVLTRHRFRMATDQEYRDRALTPPGGKAPGEGDKDKAPLPEGDGLTDTARAAATA